MRLRPNLTVSLVSACVALVIACNEKTPDADVSKEPQVSAAKNVPTVLNVSCTIQKAAPPQLRVIAEGEVPTGGWTSPALNRRVYVTAPADSIWEYDFVAIPPSGMATQVITPISAEDTWPDYPAQQVVGVRIYGEGGGIKQVRLTECTTQ